MKRKKFRIEVVFIGKPQWEAGWPYIGFDNVELMGDITQHLKTTFTGLSFHSNEIITDYNPKLMKTIKYNLKESDGLLVFTIGHYGEPGIIRAGIEVIKTTDIPIILANIVYAGDHSFIKIYSSVKDKNYQIYPLSSQNYKDFDHYIEIMSNILRLKGERLLLLATESKEINWDRVMELFGPERKEILNKFPEFINQIGNMKSEDFEFFTDLKGTDQAHPWRVNPIEYRKRLSETFGVEIIREDPNEIIRYYDKVNETKAQEIATKWIEEANEVEPTRETIFNSAKMYLAFRQLLEDRDVKFFAPDCGTLLLLGRLPAFPCMAFLELSKNHIYGICESDTNSAISFMVGLYLTGRPGYVSNHTLDLINNRATYMHCVSPCNLKGEGADFLDYDIVYHGESHFLGAVPRVIFPKGETLTTIKINVAKRKMALRQGTILENVKEPGGCVSKVWVEDDTEAILENYDWESFGWHRVSFIGDWKEEFEVAATLLGLDLIKEDQ